MTTRPGFGTGNGIEGNARHAGKRAEGNVNAADEGRGCQSCSP